MKGVVTGAILGVAGVLIAAMLAPAAFAQSASANNGVAAAPSVSTAPKFTNGSVKCTADINSDGTVLSCKHCDLADTLRIGTGQYQVGFKKPCQNILAVNGWSRWVQPDTLSIGVEPASCSTADQYGDSNAVYVQCWDVTSGYPVDASFFLFVAR
jgi:hypothetical protein